MVCGEISSEVVTNIESLASPQKKCKYQPIAIGEVGMFPGSVPFPNLGQRSRRQRVICTVHGVEHTYMPRVTKSMFPVNPELACFVWVEVVEIYMGG